MWKVGMTEISMTGDIIVNYDIFPGCHRHYVDPIHICGHNPNVVVENEHILVKITQPKGKSIGSCSERQGDVTNQGQIRRAF